MQTLQNDHPAAPWLVQHPLSAEDQAAMDAMRVIVEPNKGKLQGIGARVPFDSIMEHVSAPAGVAYDANQIGTVRGGGAAPTALGPAKRSFTSMADGSTGAPHRRFGTWQAILPSVLG